MHEFTLTLGTNPNAHIAYAISINDRVLSTHRLVPNYLSLAHYLMDGMSWLWPTYGLAAIQ